MNPSASQTVFITGAAGYVGEMLCQEWSKRDDVRLIVALDKDSEPETLRNISKVVYIEHNLADEGWEEKVAKYEPEIIINTAWQIRHLYGRASLGWHWNIDGSNRLFNFAFTHPAVKRLIHFSTAAVYGAQPKNSFSHYFKEGENFNRENYPYAYEKQEAEKRLRGMYDQARKEGKSVPSVVIVRPAAITGPRGRFGRIRFGLQSALSGRLGKGVLNQIISWLTTFMPATKGWVRQFVHEDDVCDALSEFAFSEAKTGYEIYNLTPVGEPVFARDMAKAVGKKILLLPPVLVRTAFATLWHATLGRVPTCAGSWRFYSYPLLMDGTKLAEVYQCRYDSREAIGTTKGRYESDVPADLRK